MQSENGARSPEQLKDMIQRIQTQVLAIQEQGRLLKIEREKLEDQVGRARQRIGELLEGDISTRRMLLSGEGAAPSENGALREIDNYLKKITAELEQMKTREEQNHTDALKIPKLLMLKKTLDEELFRLEHGNALNDTQQVRMELEKIQRHLEYLKQELAEAEKRDNDLRVLLKHKQQAML